MKLFQTGLCFILLIAAFPSFSLAADVRLTAGVGAEHARLVEDFVFFYRVDTGDDFTGIAVSSDRALKLNSVCETDLILARASASSIPVGRDKALLFYEKVVLIGPAVDPGNLEGKDIGTALQLLHEHKLPFVGAMEDSEMYYLEHEILENMKQAGAPEQTEMEMQDTSSMPAELSAPDSLPRTGKGGYETLRTAEKHGAYALVYYDDFAAYMTDFPKVASMLIIKENPKLHLKYFLAAADPKRCPHGQYGAALRVRDWFVSAGGRKVIEEYRYKGRQVFFPITADTP